MSKPINLLSLVQAKTSLSNTAFENFKNHHSISFKDGEIDDLASFINWLTDNGCSISNFDNFVVGYKIPQIGKEFDLLRFGGDCIINIELKKTGDEEKIKKQLTRNKYYLSFTGLKTHHYTFVSESRSLCKLSDSGEIRKVEITELATLLKEHVCSKEQNFDDFFDPASYLVSPFNSTKQFLAGEYFLTLQQEEVSNIIMGHLIEHPKSGFVSLTGGAGTGKSLLAYHVARIAFEAGKKVLIIHCGILNPGHDLLISKGWQIQPIRRYVGCKFSDFDLVIIDESQRLYKHQFEHISREVATSRALCIFSFDKLQTLAAHEDKLDIESQVSMLEPISSYSLSEKIRSNKEIADFITMLFNRNKNYEIRGGKNIFLKYFSTVDDARDYLDSLEEKEWKLLRFTPSLYNVEHHEAYYQNNLPTSHTVIGQEFDNVAVAIDELFSYHINGQLIYRGSSYYHPRKMLFQNLTRARKKLLVVVINNEELLERCVTILR
jgi:hypothetical protein